MSNLPDGAFRGGEADPGIQRFGLESRQVLGVEALSLNGAPIDRLLCTGLQLMERPSGIVELVAAVPDGPEKQLGRAEPQAGLNLTAAVRPDPTKGNSRPGLLPSVRVTAPGGRLWIADRLQGGPGPDEAIAFATGDHLHVVLITKWVDLQLLTTPAA